MPQTPSTVSIAMKRAELRVRIGEHDWEKHEAQRLHVDLTLTFSYRDYFERCGGYVNYDPLRSFLQALQEKPHINRIEDFSRAILSACFEMTLAERVHLCVMKPDIFPEMEGVGVVFDVARADFAS